MSSPEASTAQRPSAAAPARLDSVDVVRGAVMVLMLLDHMRDFTHEGGITSNPLDPATTTPILYLTRWVTHLCAPTFVFLAGLGAGLQRLRGKPAPVLARFLWTRGLWLVVLELTVVRTVVSFNWDLSMLAFLQVIWAIGAAMIVLGALVRLPARVVGVVGVAIVLGHNLLDRFQATPWRGPGSVVPTPLGKLWMVLHQGGFFPIADFPGPIVIAMYPVLPWVGVMLAGYGASVFYGWPRERRRRVLVLLGLSMLVAFGALRLLNVYGDPGPWAPQADALKTAMAFMNVQKYPPSALFVLATLGAPLVFLGATDGRAFGGGLGRALVTFGRVPLFFYVLQWIAAHAAGMLITAARGHSVAPYFLNLVQMFFAEEPLHMGGPLWTTYVAWVSATLLLYFPCRWFAGVKAQRRDWWLSYL